MVLNFFLTETTITAGIEGPVASTAVHPRRVTRRFSERLSAAGCTDAYAACGASPTLSNPRAGHLAHAEGLQQAAKIKDGGGGGPEFVFDSSLLSFVTSERVARQKKRPTGSVAPVRRSTRVSALVATERNRSLLAPG